MPSGPNSTASRRSAIRQFWWNGLATRAAHEGSSQRDRELSSDCCDRVFDVPLGPDRRCLGVWDGRISETFRAAGSLRGNRRSFADEETISGDAKGCMMMEAAPASSFEMGQGEFAFQFLAVVAAPSIIAIAVT